jgi:hypothetical protein
MIIFFLVRSIYKVDHETHWNVAIARRLDGHLGAACFASYVLRLV